MSKHDLAMKIIKRIEIGAPNHTLTMKNIHHGAVMIQNVHHDQLSELKQFSAQQQEDTTVTKT